jgi:hypothetical protein
MLAIFLTKLFLWPGIIKLFPVRGPAGDGKIAILLTVSFNTAPEKGRRYLEDTEIEPQGADP